MDSPNSDCFKMCLSQVSKVSIRNNKTFKHVTRKQRILAALNWSLFSIYPLLSSFESRKRETEGKEVLPFEEYPSYEVFGRNKTFIDIVMTVPKKLESNPFIKYPSLALFARWSTFTAGVTTVSGSQGGKDKRKRDDEEQRVEVTKKRRLCKKKASKKLTNKMKVRRNNYVRQPVTVEKASLLKIGYSNIGLRGLSSRSLQEATGFAEEEELDILFLSELKLQEGDTSFKREVKGFDVHESLRVSGKAGGMLAMVKETRNLNYDFWDGNLEQEEGWLAAERMWIRLQHGNRKTAVCGIYARVNKPSYYDKNRVLWNKIEEEMTVLTNLGYSCSVIGDMNAHIGSTGPHGIKGNPHGINQNGQMTH